MLVLVFAVFSTSAIAAPISITCNGNGLDPVTGRVATAGVMTFGFEFDPKEQTMDITDGSPSRIKLQSVRITDGLATGSDEKWIYEINRIEGTAAIRTNLNNDPQSRRLGLGGYYYKGTCTVLGAPKF